jgi:hypothetical protein
MVGHDFGALVAPPSLRREGRTVYFGEASSPRKRVSSFTATSKWDSRFRGNDAVVELAMQKEFDVNTPLVGRWFTQELANLGASHP